MKRKEYRSILGQLPIKSPTRQDMARLCPHLAESEAVEAFTTGSGYVACPPIRVRNGFQILSYHKEWVEEINVRGEMDGKPTQVITGTKNHPPQLESSYAGRTIASYADGKPHDDDVFTEYAHMKEAMLFAEINWPEDLVLDTWESSLGIYIQDPTDLVNDRYHTNYPRTKAVLHVMLSRELNEIHNDHSKPESELIDDVIAEMTLDKFVCAELSGDRGGYTHFNCARCASGLGLSGCPGCGYKFHDDQFRCGGAAPLSRKMVTFLREKGHSFSVDPEIAWAKERQPFIKRKAAANIVSKTAR